MHRPSASAPHQRRAVNRRRSIVSTLAFALVFGALTACGGELTPSAGGRAGPGVPKTTGATSVPPRITTSPPASPDRPTTPSPTGPATTATHPPTTRKPQPDVHSDDVGRRYDLGVIVDVAREKGVPVIVLDRWTIRDVSDAQLARDGYPLAPHSGNPFYNINNQTTYRIPVARGAHFTYQHCTDISKPMETRSSSLRQLAHLPQSEEVVLVTLDSKGRATEVRNDPAC